MKRRIENISYDEESGRAILQRRNVITKIRYSTVKCKFCGDVESVMQYGFTAKGIQRYICQKCKRTFIDNKAPERMQYSTDVIASAINQFYESSSLHKIARQIKLDFGVSPSHMTIYRWITRYSQKASKVLSNVPVKVSPTWVADETVIKLKSGGGENVWFWDALDDKTKFLLASHISEGRTTKDAQVLMERAERRAGDTPRVVITDKLRSYLDAVERTWGADTEHIRTGPFVKGKKEDSTRAVERFQGTLKDRTKVMRALTDKRSARIVLDGWLAHYNFFRPHQSLKGKTPAEAAGAKAPFRNWRDVIKS